MSHPKVRSGSIHIPSCIIDDYVADVESCSIWKAGRSSLSTRITWQHDQKPVAERRSRDRDMGRPRGAVCEDMARLARKTRNSFPLTITAERSNRASTNFGSKAAETGNMRRSVAAISCGNEKSRKVQFAPVTPMRNALALIHIAHASTRMSSQ